MLDNLTEVSRQIYEINKNNGWNVTIPKDREQEYKIPAVISLIHSETSEALEAFRKDDMVNFKEEMADIIIRVLDLTYGLEIDIECEIYKKLEKNKTRGYRHGNKKV